MSQSGAFRRCALPRPSAPLRDRYNCEVWTLLSCLATLRGVRDPAAQLAFELEYAKSEYGLGVAPAHIGQIKSQCFVRLRSFFSADVAELEV